MLKHYLGAMLLLITAGSALFAADGHVVRRATSHGAILAPNRYAVILSDPPVARRFAVLRGAGSAAAESYRGQIATSQTALRAEIEKRSVRVTGAVQTVLNAIFVTASTGQVEQLRALPGVKAVVPLRRYRRNLNQAVQLTNVPAAWAQLNGVGNAGAGVKIAILDTGIDQTHPAFQDASLPTPAAGPGCNDKPGQPNSNDCAFTNKKVIVARSYVSMLAAGSPETSTPDDLSPLDRSGHGTAVAMTAAGATNTGPLATITGVAPKAFLGNYKIFGTPGINDGTDDGAVSQALQDAFNDGMDIAELSEGGSALSGPLDEGAICGNAAGVACDVQASQVEKYIGLGMTVVVAAGNDDFEGASGGYTLSTIDSPGTAPSAITAGASSNEHYFSLTAVQVQGPNLPSNLQSIALQEGDGAAYSAPLTAPLVDVTGLDGTGLACSALPGSSLSGKMALILRGTCIFAVKVLNAQNAGAAGVILRQTPGRGAAIGPGGLFGTLPPTVMIGDYDGETLVSYLASNPGATATIIPALVDSASGENVVAYFSSLGPSIDMALKPEVAAVGMDMYMAAESFDRNGDMYDPSGYTAADGTSFSTPMIAGAVALVKQQNPSFTPWQLKSAVVNTAAQSLTDFNSSGTASAIEAGNGLLNAGNALQSVVTVNPSAISFGALASGTTPAQTLTVHYSGSSPATLTLAAVAVNGAAPSLNKTSLTVAPGQADQTVTLTLPGSLPAANIYEGGITIQGAGANLRVPYIYVVADGFPNDVPGGGGPTDGTVSQSLGDGVFAIRVIDSEGVSVANWPVSFTVASGGGTIFDADTQTNAEGVASAGAALGPTLGIQEFDVNIARFGTVPFQPWARALPTITAVTNSASLATAPISPGSYITLWGSGLSDYTGQTTVAALPLAILFPDQTGVGADSNVSVSFDVPSAGISVPGRMLYVSPGQVNLQAPWELAGQQSVEIKVTVGSSFGQVFTAPVANYSPAVYQVPDSGSGQEVAAAEDLSGALILTGNPAHAGQTIQLYLNGLGPVTSPPAIGFVAQVQPLSTTVGTPPVVTIGGKAANVLWSGLTPTESGLCQINLTLAPDTPTGTQPLVVSIGGVSSPPVNIVVQ